MKFTPDEIQRIEDNAYSRGFYFGFVHGMWAGALLLLVLMGGIWCLSC